METIKQPGFYWYIGGGDSERYIALESYAGPVQVMEEDKVKIIGSDRILFVEEMTGQWGGEIQLSNTI